MVGRVIVLAAGLDTKPAAAYVAAYARAEEEAAKRSGAASQGRESAGRQATQLYLRIAIDLIGRDVALAAATAERSFAYGITADTLVFLATLRKSHTAAADRFAAAATLESVGGRGGDDVNELFLRYAYVFASPPVPYAGPQGLGLQQIPDYEVRPGADEGAGLRAAYLRAAASLLLDPARDARAQLGQLPAGPAGDYYFLKTIEPHVATYAPSLAPPLAARISALSGALGQERNGSPSGASGRDETPSQESEGSEAAASDPDLLLRRASDETDGPRRDQLLFRAAMLGARSGTNSRRRRRNKLSPSTRASAKPFVIYVAGQLVADGDLKGP